MIYPITRYDAIFSLVGGQLAGGLEGTNMDYADGQTPPTEAEIDAEVIQLQAEYDAKEYARNRDAEYPTVKDQLDYMFHNGFDKWKEDIVQPVKDKYPKPE